MATIKNVNKILHNFTLYTSLQRAACPERCSVLKTTNHGSCDSCLVHTDIFEINFPLDARICNTAGHSSLLAVS